MDMVTLLGVKMRGVLNHVDKNEINTPFYFGMVFFRKFTF